MKSYYTTIAYEGGKIAETIEARHNLSHYAKHYPHVRGLDKRYLDREEAEVKMARLKRTISFMDRFDLVSCTARQKRLQWLSLGGVLSEFERHQEDPATSMENGWDHVSFWRHAGERVPALILTEPYHLDDRVLASFDALADRYVLEYRIDNDLALWYPEMATTVAWYRAGECPVLH